VRQRIVRFALPFFEPAADIFGAAVLRAAPDLRLMVAIKVILLMLHGAISYFCKNSYQRRLLTGNDGQRRVQKMRGSNRGDSRLAIMA
jgi:hypothetical protein